MTTATQLRDEGIQKAVNHTENVTNGWNKQCFELFQQWLTTFPTGNHFVMEDFNEWALTHGLDKPASYNTFGHLPRKAAGKQLIQSVGVTTGKKNRSHAGRITIWKKL